MFKRARRPRLQTRHVNFQTIRLSAGKHHSPEHGACVMELASMLAGDRFTDRPTSVCPVIGSLLRTYNDSLDDDRRQDLYPYAAKVVGSRASAVVRRARADRLNAWITARQRPRRLTWLLRPLRSTASETLEALGRGAVRTISRHTDETHASVLALIDELLRIGDAAGPDGVQDWAAWAECQSAPRFTRPG